MVGVGVILPPCGLKGNLLKCVGSVIYLNIRIKNTSEPQGGAAGDVAPLKLSVKTQNDFGIFF